MFENFRIKRLQEKIFCTGDYRYNIKKSIEELKELQQELESVLFDCDFYVSRHDLKRRCGNLQKEIADVENIISKLKIMFVRTNRQRIKYRQAGADIVKSLKEYLRRVVTE